MGLHLIPFAAGLAVGAIATYGSRDETVQKEVKEGAHWLVSGAERLYDSVVSGVSNLVGFRKAEEPKQPPKRGRAKKSEKTASATTRKRTRTKKTGTTTATKRATTRTRRKPKEAEAA
jgi:hypothetical protein